MQWAAAAPTGPVMPAGLDPAAHPASHELLDGRLWLPGACGIIGRAMLAGGMGGGPST